MIIHNLMDVIILAIVSVGVKLFCNGGGGTQQFTGDIIRLFGVDNT